MSFFFSFFLLLFFTLYLTQTECSAQSIARPPTVHNNNNNNHNKYNIAIANKTSGQVARVYYLRVLRRALDRNNAQWARWTERRDAESGSVRRVGAFVRRRIRRRPRTPVPRFSASTFAISFFFSILIFFRLFFALSFPSRMTRFLISPTLFIQSVFIFFF